jgi:hypothetical protein
MKTSIKKSKCLKGNLGVTVEMVGMWLGDHMEMQEVRLPTIGHNDFNDSLSPA